MEFSNIEAETIDRTANDSAKSQLTELDTMQLAMVGGGSGDVHFG